MIRTTVQMMIGLTVLSWHYGINMRTGALFNLLGRMNVQMMPR